MNFKVIVFSLFSSVVFASMPLEVSMLKVVTESDHVLTVQIIDVDMINDKGDQITDLSAMTGPGKDNLIRLICEVKNIHLTNVSDVPKIIKIPLDGFMHYLFGQIKKAHKNDSYPMIAVLKGGDFKPAYAGIFQYPLYELETIIALFSLKK